MRAISIDRSINKYGYAAPLSGQEGYGFDDA